MRTIGITGAQGFLGWHLSCYLGVQGDVTLKRAHRTEFASEQSLQAFVEGCDAIIHCAGMNRGEDPVVEATNVQLTEQLLSALQSTGSKAQVLFANSTHHDRPTAFGESKRVCSRMLAQWAQQSGGIFTDVILPGVFGECGKPFYNSVVSTFCHQIAVGETPQLHQDVEVEQLHAQSAAQQMARAIDQKTQGPLCLAGRRIKTSALLEQIRFFDQAYRALIVPDLREDFDLALFNTFRSYLFPHYYPVDLLLRQDARGTLFEMEKNANGGQTFASTTVPGVTRGNHFHFHKIERFCVVQGEAMIRIRRLYSDEVHEFPVKGSAPQFVDMPTLHTHNITNTGDSPLLTLFWSANIFDPERPDTYAVAVQREQCQP